MRASPWCSTGYNALWFGAAYQGQSRNRIANFYMKKGIFDAGTYFGRFVGAKHHIRTHDLRIQEGDIKMAKKMNLH